MGAANLDIQHPVHCQRENKMVWGIFFKISSTFKNLLLLSVALPCTELVTHHYIEEKQQYCTLIQRKD